MRCRVPAGRRVGETLEQQPTLTLHDDETSLPWPVARVCRVVVVVSPITPGTTAVAVVGLALVVPGVAVLIWWLHRNWNW
jgi:hypothetical protein